MPEEGELTKCQAERKEALAVADNVQDGPFVPECDDDGSYSSEQCYWQTCWCVLNPNGEIVKGTEVTIENKGKLDCDSIDEKPLPNEPPPKRSTGKSDCIRENKQTSSLKICDHLGCIYLISPERKQIV